jgi:hypothetical protein
MGTDPPRSAFQPGMYEHAEPSTLYFVLQLPIMQSAPDLVTKAQVLLPANHDHI